MEFDAAIIGASTSGLYAAQLLASQDRSVAVFEKKNPHQPARRTYIVTSGLDRVLDEIPASLVLHTIQAMEVETAQAQNRIPLKKPEYILERAQLTRYLEEQARAAGAEMHCGARFVGFRGSNQIVIEAEGQERTYSTRVVIGADGVSSAVAQSLELPLFPRVPLAQAEIDLPEDWDPTVTRVWFDVEKTPYFYWLIPEGPERAVAGLIAEPGMEIRNLLDEFLNQHGFSPVAYQQGTATMHRPGLKSWGQWKDLDIYLVGDAAGQVKVTTVGGTVTGLWGAKAAARAILQGTSYRTELRSLRRELNMHWCLRLLLERLDHPGYDHLVRLVNEPVKRFLGRYDRDQIARHLWKLLFLQPRFIPLGLRLILGLV